MSHPDSVGRLPAAFTSLGTPSFVDFLASHAPDLLPGRRTMPAGGFAADELPHATTIVAVAHKDGIVMGGDRRATTGNLIAQRDVEKVYPADEFSCIGMAGVAGIAEELVRLFQLELSHYEKMTGQALSLEGKANRLASMIRGVLSLAMQGLAVVPLFAGYDDESGIGRIFSYDVTGGRYEEHTFYSVGSGSVFARGALKKLYRRDLAEEEAVLATIHALYDAADDDSATGGPDLSRRIFPAIASVTSDGFRRLPDDEVGQRVQNVVDDRMEHPDGPSAPLQ